MGAEKPEELEKEPKEESGEESAEEAGAEGGDEGRGKYGPVVQAGTWSSVAVTVETLLTTIVLVTTGTISIGNG